MNEGDTVVLKCTLGGEICAWMGLEVGEFA